MLSFATIEPGQELYCHMTNRLETVVTIRQEKRLLNLAWGSGTWIATFITVKNGIEYPLSYFRESQS